MIYDTARTVSARESDALVAKARSLYPHDLTRQLAALAKVVADSAPKKQSKNSVTAQVDWFVIHAIRKIMETIK